MAVGQKDGSGFFWGLRLSENEKKGSMGKIGGRTVTPQGNTGLRPVQEASKIIGSVHASLLSPHTRFDTNLMVDNRLVIKDEKTNLLVMGWESMALKRANIK